MNSQYLNSDGTRVNKNDFVEIDKNDFVTHYFNVVVLDGDDRVLGMKYFSEYPTDEQLLYTIKSFDGGFNAEVHKIFSLG